LFYFIKGFALRLLFAPEFSSSVVVEAAISIDLLNSLIFLVIYT
jgi:hypothetical protein